MSQPTSSISITINNNNNNRSTASYDVESSNINGINSGASNNNSNTLSVRPRFTLASLTSAINVTNLENENNYVYTNIDPNHMLNVDLQHRGDLVSPLASLLALRYMPMRVVDEFIQSNGYGIFIHDHLWGSTLGQFYEHDQFCGPFCFKCNPMCSSYYEEGDQQLEEMRYQERYFDVYGICYCDGYLTVCPLHYSPPSSPDYDSDTLSTTSSFADLADFEDEEPNVPFVPPTLAVVPYSQVHVSQCAICLDSSNRRKVSLTCGHHFHEECIILWLRGRYQCPLCRGTPQMFSGVRRAYTAISTLNETVENIQETIDTTLEGIRNVGKSINRGVETFELIMHVISISTNENEGVLYALTQLWHAMHIVSSLGKIMVSTAIPHVTNMFETIDMNDVGTQEVDFGSLLATSVAAYNLLPTSLRMSLDFMTRHSRSRFLTDSTVFSSAFHYILSAPRLILSFAQTSLPVDFPFHRTAHSLIQKAIDAFDLMYLYLPGTVENAMLERATDLIQQFAKNASVVRSQAFIDDFNEVYEFYLTTYHRTASHIDVPNNLRYIMEALKAINRVKQSQERTTRVEPVWFHFYGGSGRGKSTITAAMLEMFDMSSYVHQRKPDQKEFFDGYNNEEIFAEDDLTSDDQFHKYLSFISPIAQPLECCDSHMKGIKKFTSNIVFTTSNYLASDMFKKKVETAKAVHRRYYSVHFSDVQHDGTKFICDPTSSFNVTPTLLVYKYDVKTDMENCVLTCDANDYTALANFICDKYDENYNTHNSRPQLTPFSRKLAGTPQVSLAQIVNVAQNAIDQIVSSAPVVWTTQHATNFLNRYLNNIQAIPNQQTCVICLSPMLPAMTTTLHCGHTYCTGCIMHWHANQRTTGVAATCPTCRQVGAVPTNNHLSDWIRNKCTQAYTSVEQFFQAHPILQAIFYGTLSGFMSGMALRLSFLAVEWIIQKTRKKKIKPQITTRESHAGVHRVNVQLAGEPQVYPGRVTESFQTELERVRNNMLYASLVFDSGDTANGIITFVDGLSFICPAHFLLLQGVMQTTCTVYAEDQECAQLISGQRFVVKYFDIASDLVIMTFQVSNQPRLFRNISNIFSGELNNHDLFLVTPDQKLPIPYPSRLKCDIGYFVFAEKTICAPKDSITYPYQADGLCGALLITKEGKILGMHALREHINNQGVARLFSRQVRMEILKCCEIGEQRKLSPISAFVVDAKNLYRHVPSETSISPSDLYEVFPVERAPAKLIGKNENGENILTKAVNKNILPVSRCSELAMQYVDYALGRFLGTYISKELTEIEVIHGTATIPRMEPTSASGIPYKGKNSVNIDYEHSTYSDAVRNNIQKMRNEFETNTFDVSTIVFGDTLKDELRDLPKIFKPRLFAAGPVHFTIELKRMFADLVYRFCEKRLENGVMIGINALGEEWDKFARKLQSRGPGIIPGDFENWDGGMLARFQELLNKHLSQRTSDPSYALWLLTHLLRTTRLVLDEMIVTTHSVPSGHGLTAFYNSIINFMYQAYAYFLLCPFQDKSFSYIYDQQMKNIYSGKYGDDVAMNVSDKALVYFNAFSFTQVMRDLGIGFTTEDKKEHTQPFCSLSDITFLKRSFVFHSKIQRIVGPLSLKTLQSSISFVSDKYRMEELVDEKVTNFQREIYLHEFLYDPLMQILKTKYFDVYHMSPPLLDENDLLQLYQREEIEATYGLTGSAQVLKYVRTLSHEADTDYKVGVCVNVVIDGKRKVLLVKGQDFKQYNGSITRGKWGIPKGSLKNYESIEAGALRELREETGLSLSSQDFINVYHGYKCTVFSAEISFERFLTNDIDNIDEVTAYTFVQFPLEVELNKFTRDYFK